MIDRGTRDLYQDLVACDRGRRYFIEYQLSTVFQHSDSFHATSLLSVSIWSRVAVCPVGKLRERAAELAFQSRDIGAVADALEPFQHQRHFLAVLPDLFDGRLRERNRPTQRLGQDLRSLRHRSYVTGEIDLATVQGDGVGEHPLADPADIV